jgi:hypothetical protein
MGTSGPGSFGATFFTNAVLPGAAFFGGAWFISHAMTRRGQRLLTGGKQVTGRIVGLPSVWNAELLPGGANGGLRKFWTGAMHLASAFLPAVRYTCEYDLDGETHQMHVAVFCDEDPLIATHGEVMLLVGRPGAECKFPSPWLVCQTGAVRTDTAIVAALDGLAVDEVKAAA